MKLPVVMLVKPLKSFAARVRAKEGWVFKGPSIFGTAYATLIILGESSSSVWRWLLFLLLSLAAAGIYANVLNDLTDQQADRISNKPNRMNGRSALFKLSTISVGILLGILSALFLVPFPWALVLYVSIFLTFTAYSLRPLRLKQRGFWGALADASAARLLPHLFAAVLMVYSADNVNEVSESLLALWMFFIGVWSIGVGLRCILRHQIVDVENDRIAKVNTFAITASVPKLQKLARWLFFPMEVIGLSGVLWLINQPLLWCFLGLYLLIEWVRHRCRRGHVVILMPIKNSRLLLMQYYDLFYPLAFLAMLVHRSPQNMLLLAAHLSLFPHRLLWLSREILALAKIGIKNVA